MSSVMRGLPAEHPARGGIDSDNGDATRLLIHAAAEPGAQRWSVESLLQRLRTHGLVGARGQRVLTLEIRDLRGNRLLAIRLACQLVEVALAPGTYHVSTDFGGTQRRYTVALAPGAAFDLHLRTARQLH